MARHRIGVVLGGLAILAVATAPAQALTINSQLFSGFQQLSDNDAEFLIDSGTGTVGILDVGDRLLGISQIGTIEQGLITHNLGVAGVNELTAIFDTVILTKTTFNGTTCLTAFCFTFGAVAPATFAADFGVPLQPAGTVIQAFDDPTPDYVRTGTIAAGIASATDGSLWALLGLVGAGAFFNSNPLSDSVAVISAIPAPGNGGIFNFGLNQIPGGLAPTFLTVPCFNAQTLTASTPTFCGSGSILGPAPTGIGAAAGGFPIFSNLDVTLNVPAPGTLLLLGAGLMGLYGVSRWRSAGK